MELQPDNPRLQKGLANDLMLSDQLEEALNLFQKLGAEEPTDIQLKLRVAEIYRVKHDYAMAAEALKKAKAINPQDMEVRYEEVRLLEAQSKYSEAITLLKGLVDETNKAKLLGRRKRRARHPAGGTRQPVPQHRSVHRSSRHLSQGRRTQQRRRSEHFLADYRNLPRRQEQRRRPQGSRGRRRRHAHPHGLGRPILPAC